MTLDGALKTIADATLVAIGGGFITGLVFFIRWLISIGRQIKAISESVVNIAAVATATLEMQPPMTRAIRTIIEVTAENKINGNVEKAHKALNQVEEIHSRIMKDSIAACTSACMGEGAD